MEVLSRFEAKYIPEPNSGCWLWFAANANGYGKIIVNGRLMSAHRLSWILHKGPIPENLHVLHKCDIPSCVNPQHLFIGTRKDNMRDMSKKRRQVFQRKPHRAPIGERNGRCKLTEADVAAIYRLWYHGKKLNSLAEMHAISKKQISSLVHDINRGRRWQHLDLACLRGI